MTGAVVLATAALAQVPLRLLSREAARYLELSAEQVGRLDRIDAEWTGFVAERQEQARRTEAALDAESRRPVRDDLRIREATIELDTICRQATERETRIQQQARGVLTPPQLARLAALEQALSLMPAIEAAQAAHLLPKSLSSPPAGLPDGIVEAQITYQRAAPAPLPGCRPAATRLRREVEPVGPGGAVGGGGIR